MTKPTWQTSSLKPPHWWQLHLANGMITISIQYRETFDFPVGDKKIQIFKQSGYHTQVGEGWAARRNVLSTLPEAKAWGIQAAHDVLKDINQELKPEIPWLLWICLIGAIALHISWVLTIAPQINWLFVSK